MNRFENLDAITFLTSIENSSVDLIHTDPPYIISRKTGFGSIGEKGVKRFAVSMDFGEWDNEDVERHEEMMKSVIKEYYRVIKQGGTCIIWYDLFKIESLKKYLEDAGFKQIRFIEWVKTNPVPLNSKRNYLTGVREIALTAVKGGKPTFHSEYDNGIYSAPIHRDGGKRIHPTQKSLSITKELIEKHSNPGEIVLDTFCGSATTLCAATELERKYLGCEISEKYFVLAENRLGKLQ